MLKMQPELSEAMKIQHFRSHLQKDGLQTFRNIHASNKRTVEDVLIITPRKYVRPKSQARAKYKWHKLTLHPHKKSLSDFVEEPIECAERGFGPLAKQMMDSLFYAKLPPHLKRSINPA